ncbi:MAG: UDP-N-acetylmuramate dehydrogenase [Anaerolineae bacterium]|nr:UDP-N-acetylmuramate dehydrogenase [Anaerolineae bacterium]
MTLPQPAHDALQSAFGERLLIDEPLTRHSSARIGGPADALLVAKTGDDLRTAARLAWEHNVPLTILGSGSNVLISDAGVRGLVIHNRAAQVTFDDACVIADSGVGVTSLTRQCAQNDLSGFEWAVGIPGTLGGAVYGNAGAHGGDMSGIVVSIDMVTPKGDITMSNAELAFQYRSSVLKREPRPCLIECVTMRFIAAPSTDIEARMAEFNDHRKRTQPPGATIGSMFKNPPGDYAGRLIEAAGLKGKQAGGAQISKKHANFFLNTGDASAEDVKVLIDQARWDVWKQFGVELELEVELVGEW